MNDLKERNLDNIRLAQGGDLAARNTLVVENYGMIRHAIHGAIRHGEVDDYVSHGVEAFIRAVNNFDPSMGFQFSTFAITAIKRAVWGAANEDRLIRLPGLSGKESEDIIEKRSAALKIASINAPRHDDDGGWDIEDESSQVDHEQNEQLARLKESIAGLPPRLREVIRRRMAGQTLAQIGRLLRVTTERVRQLECDAESQLRESMLTQSVFIRQRPCSPWTDGELRYLRSEHARGATVVRIAKSIGRHYTSVVAKATSLDLRRIRYWTPAEDAFIRSHKHLGWAGCAEKMDRTATAIRNRAIDIGIQFKKKDKADIAAVRELHALGLTTTEIGLRLNLSGECIRVALHGIGVALNRRDEKKRMATLLNNLAAKGFSDPSEARERKRQEFFGNTSFPSSATFIYIVLARYGKPATARELMQPAKMFSDAIKLKVLPRNRFSILFWLGWLVREGCVSVSRRAKEKLFAVANSIQMSTRFVTPMELVASA